MLKINFKGQKINCVEGDNLRKVLRQANLTPHNGRADWFNCKGIGSCGTCAVKIKGEVSPLTTVEKWRLNFPPHNIENGLRLACQCFILSNLKIEKYDGFWGENVL
jgi:ferredoxin